MRFTLRITMALTVLAAALQTSAQTNQWTFKGGSTLVPMYGVYGTKGVSSAGKPGGRSNEITWKDNSGNYWFFGGFGYARATQGYLNDLWKYNPSTGEWTWMSGSTETAAASVFGTAGIADDANVPGARNGGVGWTDANGDLWLFGGYTGSIGFSDLWKYTISTGKWTWYGGTNAIKNGTYGTKGTAAAGNWPGGRYNFVGWKDASGNLWLLGGTGYPTTGTTPVALNDLWQYNITSGQWTWMGGENTANSNGVYGTKGTPAATNKPGARAFAISATDPGGNFWLIGGSGLPASGGSGFLNDVWKYTVSTGQWTWISGDNTYNNSGVYGTKGTGSTSNKPGSRYTSKAVFDASGNLWLYSGIGLSTGTLQGSLNDLWKFSPATLQWTWVAGDNSQNIGGVYGTKGVESAANLPGCRQYPTLQIDASNNLWLFGGYGYFVTGGGQLYMSDLWKFSTTTSQWTWLSGDRNPGILANGGTKGVPGSSNWPGGRNGAAVWQDNNGDIWTFGGFGYGPAFSQNSFNDLYKYTRSTGQWTWVSGDSTQSSVGIYGTKGVEDATSIPGARYYAKTWKDNAGNLYLFGGLGYASNTTNGSLNDLWKLNPVTGKWTWISGDNLTGQYGVYGTQGVPSATNKPGSRYLASGWQDSNGDYWLFGGLGYSTSEAGRYLNDLWKFTSSTGQWTWMGGSTLANAKGVYGLLKVEDASNYPGARQAATTWLGKDGTFWMYGGYSSSWPAGGANTSGQDFWKYDPSTSKWTWVGGDTTGTNKRGKYNVQGVPSDTILPGSNAYGAAWTDNDGIFWLFGGTGFDMNTGTSGVLADWWSYDPAGGNWTWMKGNGTVAQTGVYGTQGTPATGNQPGSRSYAITWKDNADGQLYLLGGQGFAANASSSLNDMWSIQPQAVIVPLPIKLSSFNGRWLSDHTVQLQWRSETEQNSQAYIIERSATGQQYTPIGTVPANGHGSSYSFTDPQPQQKNYYRLRMVDIDGKKDYSNTVILSSQSGNFDSRILNNPVRNTLQVQVNATTADRLQIQIVNASGLAIYSSFKPVAAGATSLSIAADRWPAGYYALKVTGTTGSKTIAFIKL